MTAQRGQQDVSLARMVAAQTRLEVTLAFRRAEGILVTLIIPSALLLFLGTVPVIPAEGASRVDFLVPGLIALSVISSSLVALGIATGFERYYHVLKRLGGSPLPRPALILSKMLSTLTIEAVQIALLGLIGWLVFGWVPRGPVWLAVPALILGTSAFAGIGLWLAGTLRAEGTLAVTNGLYLLLMALGGTIFPLSVLPSSLAQVAGYLPAAALSEFLRAALIPGSEVHWGSVMVLAVWAVVTPAGAAMSFSWD
ncbi:MAG: ABC transporter permease [Chloroflexota bacterium]